VELRDDRSPKELLGGHRNERLTKEQLGGYYILECKNIDEAVAYAAKIPGAGHGSVEVRPVLDMG